MPPSTGHGKEVGITIFEALSAAGLTRYDEATTPTRGLSDEEILRSYSTFMAPAEVIGGISYPAREKIFRIRGISNDYDQQEVLGDPDPPGDRPGDRSEETWSSRPIRRSALTSSRTSTRTDCRPTSSSSCGPPTARCLSGPRSPGVTDFKTDMSVTFSTDPGFVTGSIVRVTETGGGLTAGTNYFIRNLGGGTYSFYLSAAGAAAGGTAGRVPLNGKITAGIFAAAKPIATDTTAEAMSVSFAAKPTLTDFTTAESVTFGTDPGFVTGTAVQVTKTGGGLSAGTNYFIRKLSGGSYAFYDSAANASATAATSGRINLSGDILAGILRTTDRSFPTGTVVQVTSDSGGLIAGTNYFIRNLGEGSYSFYLSALDATAGSDVKTGLVSLTGNGHRRSLQSDRKGP